MNITSNFVNDKTYTGETSLLFVDFYTYLNVQIIIT